MENNKIKNIVEYFVAIITEFADRFNLTPKQAYRYIKINKGIDFINEFYDTIHTQSFDDAVESVRIICSKNGGRL